MIYDKKYRGAYVQASAEWERTLTLYVNAIKRGDVCTAAQLNKELEDLETVLNFCDEFAEV